jgi:hypothetical protein
MKKQFNGGSVVFLTNGGGITFVGQKKTFDS